jgi:hypothetical protein
LHKWNLLAVAIGRPARDALVLAIIALCLILTLAGVVLRLKPAVAVKSEAVFKKTSAENLDAPIAKRVSRRWQIFVAMLVVFILIAFTQRHLIHSVEQRLASAFCQHNPNFCETVRNTLLDNPQLRAFCEEQKETCKALRSWL